MNYQHSYHAGGFADVFKHWILTLILEKLQQKDTAFGVLDTHAGAGFYDLMEEQAQKTGEYHEGIACLLKADPIPAAFTSYCNLIKRYQPFANKIQYYPGSPEIIQHYLRSQDSLIACELHQKTYEHLRKHFKYSTSPIAIHQQDAYLATKAFLPLKEKRGLILIDPPFEVTNEFEQIISAIKPALHHFKQGIYAIWYPIKHRPPVSKFYQQLQQLAPEKILIAEILRRDDHDANTLNGCGMAIINPPWQLQTILKDHLPWLAKQFALTSEARSEVMTF